MFVIGAWYDLKWLFIFGFWLYCIATWFISLFILSQHCLFFFIIFLKSYILARLEGEPVCCDSVVSHCHELQEVHCNHRWQTLGHLGFSFLFPILRKGQCWVSLFLYLSKWELLLKKLAASGLPDVVGKQNSTQALLDSVANIKHIPTGKCWGTSLHRSLDVQREKEERMRRCLTASPTQKHSFPRQSKWVLPPSDFRAPVMLSRQINTILWVPEINCCRVWAVLSGSPFPIANTLTLSEPFKNLSSLETRHFPVCLCSAPSEMHGWKQTEVTQKRDATFSSKGMSLVGCIW